MDADGRFYRRDAKGGNERMNYYEIQTGFAVGTGQLRRVRLLRMELRVVARQVERILNTIAPASTPPHDPNLLSWRAADRFDGGTLKALLVDVVDVLPLGVAEKIHGISTWGLTLNPIIELGQGRAEDAKVVFAYLQAMKNAAVACEVQLAAHFGPLSEVPERLPGEEVVNLTL
jgi:hypothetical protein